MGQWFRIGLTFASALLCAATFAVWVASLTANVLLMYTWQRRDRPIWTAFSPYVQTSPHQVEVAVQRIAYEPRHEVAPLDSIAAPGFGWERTAPAAAEVADVPRRLGFAAADQQWPDMGSGTVRLTSVTVPFWALMTLTVIAPARAAWRGLARLRRPSTACRACGYDLRASPGRCPECGATPGRPWRCR